MKNILYVNACVREESRTDQLARHVLQKLGSFTEVNLNKADLQPLHRETLERRLACISAGDFSSSMFDYAKQFAAADIIVISAPFWDLSFPSLLKVYLENIYVIDLVTSYQPDGSAAGLCKAEKLYYVSTAGGKFERKYGYDCVRDLVMNYFGVQDTELIYAEMLDIEGYSAEAIMQRSFAEIDQLFC